jgi:hypothetical protein
MTNEPAERLRVHSIGGYEWECDECHFHYYPAGEACAVCGARPAEDGGYHDSTGQEVDHTDLISRQDHNAALAAERRATVERIRAQIAAQGIMRLDAILDAKAQR